MDWEWRLFFPKNNSEPLFSVVNENSNTAVEERTDVYMLIPSYSCLGLKSRGGLGRHLELKVRLDTKEGGWELWTKFSIDRSDLKHGISEALGRCSRRYPHLSAVQQYVLFLDDSSLVELKVEKQRIQFYTNECESMEQTDLKIYDSTGNSLGEYRSIAVEGNNMSTSPTRILQDMGRDLANVGSIWGYPEFLASLLDPK